MRNISRAKAVARVDRALSDIPEAQQSYAWDFAWKCIRALESRGKGIDREVAEKLSDRMRAAARMTPERLEEFRKTVARARGES